jgi:hypothetical protein
MRALLILGLICAIGYAADGTAEQAETVFTPSEQIEVHSVVVDEPQVKALPQGSGDIWDLLVELDALDLLKVSSATNIT